MGKGIIYKVKKGETLESLAEDFGISVDELRRFHNNWCEDIRDQIGYDIWEGKKLTVEKEKLSKEEVQDLFQRGKINLDELERHPAFDPLQHSTTE